MEVLPISGTSADISDEHPDGRDPVPRFTRFRQRVPLLFIGVVVVPVLIAISYFGVLASDVYISESQFVVRAPQKSSPSPLGAILQSAGFTNASDEANAAQSFAVSRDALRALNQNDAFKKAYTRPDISIVDRFDPLGLRDSFEHLFQYYQTKVTLNENSSTSSLTLVVKAYDPQDAYRFNQKLLSLTEATVNKLNERGRQDLIQYAQAETDVAKARSQAAAVALASYRNRSGIVDPEIEAQAKMQMIATLQNQLIGARTELAQIQRYAPENPRIPVIRSQIGTLQGEIRREMGEVTGGQRSLTRSAVQFQRLTLENDFAGKQLAASLASLEAAKDEARRKQAYVERIVEPNLPDSPMEPRRLRGIFATLVLSLLAYGILRMLLVGLREHAQ